MNKPIASVQLKWKEKHYSKYHPKVIIPDGTRMKSVVFEEEVYTTKEEAKASAEAHIEKGDF